MNGKGDKQRPTNKAKYDANYDRIFGTKPEPAIQQHHEEDLVRDIEDCPAEYTISIKKGCFDGEVCFEARVKELPEVAEYADSYEEAYELAIDTIETIAEIFAEK